MLFCIRELRENMKKYNKYIVPSFFLILSILAIIGARVSLNFVLNELYSRFIRNGIFMISLIIPIISGMGLNFAISIGAIAAQIGIVFIIDRNITGVEGYLVAIVISVLLSIVFGNVVGYILNKASGREMITSMLVGFLGNSIYQLIFMVGYGTIFIPKNKDILLSIGIGLRNTIDCSFLNDLYDGILMIKIGNNRVSLLPVIIIVIVGFVVNYISKSKLGYHMRAVGENLNVSKSLGINVNRTRRLSIVLSTVFASLGQLMVIQDLGMLSVYTGHLGLGISSSAALLVGGATFKKANLRNCYLGLLLYHTLFIVSPLAGQNLFKNAALGEYFRSFVAYGTIVLALIINMKCDDKYGKLSSVNMGRAGRERPCYIKDSK